MSQLKIKMCAGCKHHPGDHYGWLSAKRWGAWCGLCTCEGYR